MEIYRSLIKYMVIWLKNRIFEKYGGKIYIIEKYNGEMVGKIGQWKN